MRSLTWQVPENLHWLISNPQVLWTKLAVSLSSRMKPWAKNNCCSVVPARAPWAVRPATCSSAGICRKIFPGQGQVAPTLWKERGNFPSCSQTEKFAEVTEVAACSLCWIQAWNTLVIQCQLQAFSSGESCFCCSNVSLGKYYLRCSSLTSGVLGLIYSMCWWLQLQFWGDIEVFFCQRTWRTGFPKSRKNRGDEHQPWIKYRMCKGPLCGEKPVSAVALIP